MSSTPNQIRCTWHRETIKTIVQLCNWHHATITTIIWLGRPEADLLGGLGGRSPPKKRKKKTYSRPERAPQELDAQSWVLFGVLAQNYLEIVFSCRFGVSGPVPAAMSDDTHWFGLGNYSKWLYIRPKTFVVCCVGFVCLEQMRSMFWLLWGHLEQIQSLINPID